MSRNKIYRRTIHRRNVYVDGVRINYTYDTRNRMVHAPRVCADFIEPCCWDCAPISLRNIVHYRNRMAV